MKILKITFSIILSILITLLGTLIPIYFSATLLSDYKTAVNIFQKLDYTEFMSQNPKLKKVLITSGTDAAEINQRLKSKAMSEALEKYAPNINKAVLEISKTENIDTAVIYQLIDQNKEEITNIAKAYTGKNIDSEELISEIHKYIDSNSQVITYMAPNLKKAQPVLKVYEYANTSPKNFPLNLGIGAVAVTVILSAVLYVINLKNKNRLLWCSIPYGISCLLLLAAVIVIKAGITPNITGMLSKLFSDIFNAAVKIGINTISIGFTVNAVIFSILIVLYTALWSKKKKLKSEGI